MAVDGVRVRRRDIMARITITVEVVDPPGHRALRWIGVRLIRLGSRLVGFGEVRIRGKGTP